MVKSTRSVVCIDLETDTYFVFDLISGADNYGDYLASTGNRRRILIFSNINSEDISGSASKYCAVRIYTAPSYEPDPEPESEEESAEE